MKETPKKYQDRLHKNDWEVKIVPFAVCKQMVTKYHYAKGGANTATFCHGLFKKGNDECLGIAWWLPPTKAAAEASYGGDFRQVLSLSRLVIKKGVPKNAATFLISRSIKFIKQDGRFKCLVTYADTWQNHTGGIYKASNWEYMGLTKAERTYVNSEGRMVSRKAGPKTRTHAEMIAIGCKLIGSYPKHKFRILLEPVLT